MAIIEVKFPEKSFLDQMGQLLSEITQGYIPGSAPTIFFNLCGLIKENKWMAIIEVKFPEKSFLAEWAILIQFSGMIDYASLYLRIRFKDLLQTLQHGIIIR